MKKRSIFSVILCFLMAVSMSACSAKEEETTTAAPTTAAETTTAAPTTEAVKVGLGKKVAMVTDVGGVNDQSFNQAAWEGMQKAMADFGVEGSFAESTQNADYTPNLERLADQNNQVIFAIGFMMGDPLAEVAKNLTNQQFAIIDYGYETPIPNITTVSFADNESSYLVGYIAGKMTKSNKVGFVGGMEGFVISKFHYGFMAGVNKANPKAEISVQYANSFDDAAKGKAIANQMITDGCDIIFHASGSTGIGVIEACKEANIKAIGVDRDQNYLAPDNVITSAMKKVNTAVYEISKEVAEGTYKGGGQNMHFSLANDGVGIAPTSDKLVPKEILDEVETVKQEIIAGTIVVPSDKESYDAQAK